ncbi:membrane protein FAM174A [Otolemur garnettii]|nr:membrane protein FAM174A [Otolemur garnettii]
MTTPRRRGALLRLLAPVVLLLLLPGPSGPPGSGGGGLSVSPSLGDKPMTQRALTVLMVVSGAVLVYFVVRTVRMRRRNRKTRRYGVLDTNIENMELTPLEQDDEDDDNTLFDANHPRR